MPKDGYKNVFLRDPVHHQVKVLAVQQGITLTDLLERLVIDGMKVAKMRKRKKVAAQ